MKKTICFSLLAITLAACQTASMLGDVQPDFPAPKLDRKAENYEAMDYNTFPVYMMQYTLDDVDMQKPTDNMAIWLTKDATYLATAYRQHWEMMYFNMTTSEYIQDDVTQKKHYAIGTIGLPSDTTFWVKGEVGQWNVFVTVYPPLPKGTKCINIAETRALDRIPGTTGWTGPRAHLGVSIEELKNNQYKFLKEEE